ncbi:(Lyso)-N-acylphosphatidylethanolamine lipase isoform X4 [Myotis daubentonii]|uniref:(Lyso)-N-acylphosphatidylethanolamine lipase isoform X4 n=1 Tax=Myotis daubentonii TaxID=98922 RepID=UPI002873C7FB|nr:(Lyso)-N-acylphosphatidylethanolamine lipase isoform X4 [Myotis daubentonii]
MLLIAIYQRRVTVYRAMRELLTAIVGGLLSLENTLYPDNSFVSVSKAQGINVSFPMLPMSISVSLCPRPQGWLSSWLPAWRPTSMSQLKNVEAKILQCLQNKFLARYVSLPNQNKIWTVTVSPELRDRTPLVMVHGFGGGVGLWILNMDSLSARRTLHTFDLLGFGRSSRPTFPRDPEGAENEFVISIETWRETMGIPSMILLGHSLGGFLATSYSIKYPERVKHLILVDPWGFPLRPTDPSEIRAPPTWVKAVASVLGRSNPLAVLRIAGPWAFLCKGQMEQNYYSVPWLDPQRERERERKGP